MTLLWPVLLTAGIAFVQRRRLQSPVAFVVLGSLMCFGLLQMVATSNLFSGWIHTVVESPTERLFAAALNRIVESLALAVPASIPLSLWLFECMSSFGRRLS